MVGNLARELDNTWVVDENGNKRKLRKRGRRTPMTDKDNSQTGNIATPILTATQGGRREKTSRSIPAAALPLLAGEAAVDSTGKTTAGESSGGKKRHRENNDHQKHHRQDYHTLPQHDHQLPKQHQLPQ